MQRIRRRITGSARVPTQREPAKVERTGIDPPRVAG